MVLATLSSKSVKDQKLIEFKKQLVSNKSLRSYFESNPEEKEILVNDIKKKMGKRDLTLFKGLSMLPDYLIPATIMATTQE